MNGSKIVIVSLVASVFGAGCIFADSDDGDGGGGSGATSTASTGEGGKPATSTSTGDGGAGGGTTTSGGGGQGGSGYCDETADCPPPDYECMLPNCLDNLCSVISDAPGAPCSIGVCDGTGACVECLDPSDCDTGETCERGACIDQTLGGACGDNFCQLLPADSTCFSCLQSEGAPGGTCDLEYDACIDDGTSSGCVTCLEFFQAEQGSFCAGTQQIVIDLMSCMCTPGVCAE